MATRETKPKIRVERSSHISAPIALRSGSEVYSVFMKSISPADSSQKGIYVIDGSTDISIKNLSFLGLAGNFNGNDFREDGSGVVIKRAKNVLIENCEFKNFNGAGVIISSSENITFRNCRFTNCRIGVDVYSLSEPSKGITFINCEFSGGGENYIANLLRIYNAVFVEIKDCVFYAAGISERGLIDAPSGTWGNGIFMWNVENVLINNVASFDNYWSGIVIGQNSKDVIVKGCHFTSSFRNIGTTTAVWIEQSGCSGVILEGCVLRGGLSLGDNGGSEVIISNNLINGIDYGIDINEAGRNVVITGNIIRRISNVFYPESTGLHIWNKVVDGANILVSNNIVLNFVRGIYINNFGGTGTAYSITISGNRVYDCSYPFAVGGSVSLLNSQVCCNSFSSYYRWYNPSYVDGPFDLETLFGGGI